MFTLKVTSKSDYSSLGFIFIAVLIYFAPYFFSGKTPLPYDTLSRMEPWSVYGKMDSRNNIVGDVLMQYIPWRTLYRQAVYTGEIPFWNPYQFCGVPFMANYQSAVFYPFNIFFLLGDFEQGALTFLIYHLLFTGIGMYLLLRAWFLPPYAALTGSLTWMLCGYLTVWMLWFSILATLSYLPWALLTVQWLIKTGKKKAVGMLAAIIACIWSAGHPQQAYYCSLSIAGFALWRLITSEKSLLNRLGFMLKLCIAAGLGFMAVAPQLGASWEFTQHCIRSHTPVQNLLSNSIPWHHLITLIAPEFYGNARAYWGAGNFPEYTGYVSVASLILASMAYLHRRLSWKSEIIFCSVYAITVLHLAYGGWLNVPMSHLPGYTTFRGVQRFLGIWGIAVAGLAAFGIEAVLLARNWRRRVITGGMAILFIFALVSFWKTEGVVFRMSQFFCVEMSLHQFGWICDTLKWPLAIVILLSGSLIALQFLTCKAGRAFRDYGGLVIAIFTAMLIGADLIHFSRNYLPHGKIERGFDATPGLKLMQTQQDGRLVRFEAQSIMGSPLMPNTGIMYGLEDTIGYDSLTLDRYNQLFSIIEPERYGTFAHRALGSFRHIKAFSSPVMDLIGGKFLILNRPLTEQRKGRQKQNFLERNGWELIYSGDDMTIFSNQESLPFAFIINRCQVILADSEQLAFLKKPSFNPSQSAILAKMPRIPIDVNAQADIQMIRRSLNSVKMRVNVKADAGKGALTVLRQNFYPGWRAWIDNIETPIIRANFSFQAIAVPAGHHDVMLKYQPSNFKILVSIAILALLIIVVLLFFKDNRQIEKHRISFS